MERAWTLRLGLGLGLGLGLPGSGASMAVAPQSRDDLSSVPERTRAGFADSVPHAGTCEQILPPVPNREGATNSAPTPPHAGPTGGQSSALLRYPPYNGTLVRLARPRFGGPDSGGRGLSLRPLIHFDYFDRISLHVGLYFAAPSLPLPPNSDHVGQM